MTESATKYFMVGNWIHNNIGLLDPSPRAVALFGSAVRGTDRPESDIDLLLIGNQIPVKPFERTQWVYPLLEAWRKESPALLGAQRTLSPLLLSEKGWLDSVGLRLSLADEAWVLVDDGFLSSSLAEARAWIRDGLWSRKALSDGGWFWIPQKREGMAP